MCLNSAAQLGDTNCCVCKQACHPPPGLFSTMESSSSQRHGPLTGSSCGHHISLSASKLDGVSEPNQILPLPLPRPEWAPSAVPSFLPMMASSPQA